MARKALVVKAMKKAKFSTRRHLRCLECGRARAVFSDYHLCRIHVREYLNKGLIPGFRKASW